MSSGYVKAWGRDGAVYQRMLDAAEEVLRRAVELRRQAADGQPPMLHPVITREHSDAPQVSVHWQSPDGIDRVVHLDVSRDDQPSTDGQYAYGVAFAASHDDFPVRQCRWWYERPTTRADLHSLDEAILTALTAAQALSHESLKSTTELPPLPFGLSTRKR